MSLLVGAALRPPACAEEGDVIEGDGTGARRMIDGDALTTLAIMGGGAVFVGLVLLARKAMTSENGEWLGYEESMSDLSQNVTDARARTSEAILRLQRSVGPERITVLFVVPKRLEKVAQEIAGSYFSPAYPPGSDDRDYVLSPVVVVVDE